MHRLPVLLAWSLEFLACVDVDGVMVARYVQAVAMLRSLHRCLLQKPHMCTTLKLCILMLEEFFSLQIFPHEDFTSQQSQPLHPQTKHELTPLHVCSMHPVVIQRCFPQYLDSIRRALKQASSLKYCKTGSERAEDEKNNEHTDVMEVRLDGGITSNPNEVVNDARIDSVVKVVRCRKIVPVMKVEAVPVINHNNQDMKDASDVAVRRARQGADIQTRLEAGFLQIHSSSLHKSVEFVCERIFSSWNLTCQSDVLPAEAQESRKAALKVLKKLTAENFKQNEVVSALAEHLATNHNPHNIIPSIQSHLVRIVNCLSCLLPTTTVSQVLATTIQLCQRAFLLKAKHWIKQNFSFDALLRKMVSETNKMMSQRTDLKGCCIHKSFHLPSISPFIQHSNSLSNGHQLKKINSSSLKPHIYPDTNPSKHDDPPKDNFITKSRPSLYSNHFPSLTASQPLNPSSTPSLHTAKKINSKTTIVTNTHSHTPSIQPFHTSVNQPYTPSTNQPSNNQPHTPSNNQPHTPSTNQPHTPSTNQPHTPSTIQPHTPSTSQPHTPSTSQPHTPSTNQPHTPSTSQPHTPSNNQPHTPSTIQPLPQIPPSKTSKLYAGFDQLSLHELSAFIYDDIVDSNLEVARLNSAEVSSSAGDINNVDVNHINGRGCNKVPGVEYYPDLKAFEVLSLLQDKVLLNHFNHNGMSCLMHAEIIAQAEFYIQMDSELVLPVVKSQLTSLLQQLTNMG